MPVIFGDATLRQTVEAARVASAREIAVLTQGGHLMLANWLAQCGMPAALDRAPELAAEVESRRLAAFA